MKNGPSVLLLFVLTTACSHKPQTMTVVRDCSGTYLRHDNKDFHVCNDSLLRAFSDGATVKLRYRKATECTDQRDRMVCMMYHENQGWVRVDEIQP